MTPECVTECDRKQAIADFRAKWAEFRRLSDLADAAFTRYIHKAAAGERTNAAAAARLANRTNYASADMQSAASRLYAFNTDPQTIEPEFMP